MTRPGVTGGTIGTCLGPPDLRDPKYRPIAIVPAFKNSGERSHPKNYRPISLLPIISKLFERLIYQALTKHLELNQLLTDKQYGFRGCRSTADLLTVITDRIYQALNNRGGTRAVALDISKAFDRVWHAGLLHKLPSYGISGRIFGIIKSFLSGRKFQVILDGQKSATYNIVSGVPQGSILGPILFLIFINDLPDNLICDLGIYADDTTLYSSLSHKSSNHVRSQMAKSLESDLSSIVEWGKRWLVIFNVSKTQLLSGNKYKTGHNDPISM